jgi:ubiquinone/menaquinone biosynthesis C-methylase UbiE
MAEARRRQQRCAEFVKELATWEKETVTRCNVCHSSTIMIIANIDRYGLPVRTGMCMRCGLIFLIDRLTLEGYARFYEEIYRPLASAYLGRRNDAASFEVGQAQYARKIVEIFRGFIPPAEVSTLLDIGGSTGVVASEFVRAYNARVTVLDPSSEELEIARAKGHRTMHGLLENWHDGAEPFDLVLCCRTIDHFIDLRGSLLTMRNLCKPDGYVFIDIIDIEAIRTRKGMLEGALKIDHCYYLSSEVAPAIIAGAGLEVVYSEIASDPEHVTYICKPSVTAPVPEIQPVWLVERVRAFQQNRLAAIEARSQPCGLKDALRRKAYRIKKKLLGARA